MTHRLLIVDDETDFAAIQAAFFRSLGYHAETAANRLETISALSANEPDLILLDVMLGEDSGLDLILSIKARTDAPIVMVSSRGDTDIVVNAIRSGAVDYVRKPADLNALKDKIAAILARRSERTGTPAREDAILIGKGPTTERLIREISQLAHSDATVLLRGESGTGKSLIAELIHDYSRRKRQTFAAVSCTAVSEDELEAELFGATGKLRQAAGGTLFLDEIGVLSEAFQIRLLRLLQAQELGNAGAADVRIIAATNRDLEKLVREGKFREDLFYRINVLPIAVPPLRERREDIPLFADYFLQYFARKSGKRFNKPSGDVLAALTAYDWPGNVRELKNVLERAVLLGTAPDLNPADVLIPAPPPVATANERAQDILSVQELERKATLSAIEQAGGNMTKAAKILGVGRDTLYRRLKKYKIRPKTR